MADILWPMVPRRGIVLAVAAALCAAVALWFLRGGLAPAPSGVEPAGTASDAPGLAAVPDGGGSERERAARLAAGKDAGAGKPSPRAVEIPRVTGRVVDSAGKGIGGAHVLSIPDTCSKTFLPSEAGKEGCAALDALADAEGRFAVPVGKDAP